MIIKIFGPKDIKAVAERWKAQYFKIGRWNPLNLPNGVDSSVIYSLLKDVTTIEEIASIIGNTGWTGYPCIVCHTNVQKVIDLRENDWDSDCNICFECVRDLAEFVGLASI